MPNQQNNDRHKNWVLSNSSYSQFLGKSVLAEISKHLASSTFKGVLPDERLK